MLLAPPPDDEPRRRPLFEEIRGEEELRETSSMDVISLDEMVYSLWSGDDNGCSSDMIFSRALCDFSKFEIDFRGCEDESKCVFICLCVY